MEERYKFYFLDCSSDAKKMEINVQAGFIFIIKALIISKKPGNTGISRDMRTEFTTHLLHSD